MSLFHSFSLKLIRTLNEPALIQLVHYRENVAEERTIELNSLHIISKLKLVLYRPYNNLIIKDSITSTSHISLLYSRKTHSPKTKSKQIEKPKTKTRTELTRTSRFILQSCVHDFFLSTTFRINQIHRRFRINQVVSSLARGGEGQDLMVVRFLYCRSLCCLRTVACVDKVQLGSGLWLCLSPRQNSSDVSYAIEGGSQRLQIWVCVG